MTDTTARDAEQAAADAIDDAYARAIRIHCPDQDGTIDIRVRLAKMRDDAAVGMAGAMPEAAIALDIVARLATHSTHAALPASQLIRTLSALALTMEAARALHRVQRIGNRPDE